MRLYFEKICCNEKLQPVAAILSWSHYCELLKFNDENEIYYYIRVCSENNYSKRELISRIKSNEYERLDKNTKNKLISKDKSSVIDFVKNPILIKNSYKYNRPVRKLKD